jgi:hypothetical protein
MVTTEFAKGVLPFLKEERSAKLGVGCLVLKKVVGLHNTNHSALLAIH